VDGNSEQTDSFEATMYAMWQPDSANGCAGAFCTIPVPLGSIHWSWKGDAIHTLDLNQGVQGWILGPGCGAAGSPSVSLSTAYPHWETVIPNQL
jgi:hypothetical protein